MYGDTLSAPVEDQADALQAIAERFPDLDLGRVGIRGWSFGGALAAMAVIRRPDVFHAGDLRRRPARSAALRHALARAVPRPAAARTRTGTTDPRTMTEAAELTRPLLLIHGMADDNVVVAHTLRMSAALLAAGRPHQVLPLSGATHMPTEYTIGQLLRHELAFLRDALGLPSQLLLSPPRPAEQAPVRPVPEPAAVLGLVDRVGVENRRAGRRRQRPGLGQVQVAADVADGDGRDLVRLDEPQVLVTECLQTAGGGRWPSLRSRWIRRSIQLPLPTHTTMPSKMSSSATSRTCSRKPNCLPSLVSTGTPGETPS